MISFIDGPAIGKTMQLRQVPALRFLRVVQEGDKFDALDQPHDKPEPREKIYAYELHGEAGWVHLCVRGGRGGTFATGRYKFVDPQPSDGEMRSNPEWWKWQRERLESTPPETIQQNPE